MKIHLFSQYQGTFHVIALMWDLFIPSGYEEFAVSGALQEREEMILLKEKKIFTVKET